MITGSLQIKKNTYYAVINVADETGQKKPKWISTKVKVAGNNKRKAQQVLREIIQEYEESKVSYSKEIYLHDWVTEWLEQQKNNVELSTWECYKLFVDTHIVPYFKTHKVSLISLTPKHIQDYYNEKLKKGRKDGKGGLSANTIKKHSVIIRSALNIALKMNLIPYNPVDRATLPKIQKFIGKHYTSEQAEKLLKVCIGTSIEPVIILTLFYGLRRSEVLGIKWGSVDFNKNTITIQDTVVKITTIVEKPSTKNKSSNRTLPLLPDVKKYLMQLKKCQIENQLLLGSGYTVNDYVCKWEDGRAFKPDYISRKFKKILEDNDMPIIRFHDLRHTCASLLLAKGINLKEISEWLGHADISTTMNIYAHLDYEAKISAAKKMNDALNFKNIIGD